MNHTAEAQNVSVELKVFEAAAAVRAIAPDTSYQVAIDAAAIAAEQSLTRESTSKQDNQPSTADPRRALTRIHRNLHGVEPPPVVRRGGGQRPIRSCDPTTAGDR